MREIKMAVKRNIRDYLGENCHRIFRIPAYQRGYKWGVPNAQGYTDASILMDDILKAMKANVAEYFIQGVTVYEKNNAQEIVLIDGQQRTTTLFLILNELLTPEERQQYLFFKDAFKLLYDIRLSSHEYLAAICKGAIFQGDENTQDICFFKKAQDQIRRRIQQQIEEADCPIDRIRQYVLEQVMLFYISVPKEQAANVFSMLNGSKAFMKTDELIKADFLCKATNSDLECQKRCSTDSIDETFNILRKQLKEETGRDWESSALRSQYARQWDKWLYWWNREDVRAFFDSGTNPMGLLIEVFCELKKPTLNYSNRADDVAVIFKAFQREFLQNSIKAKCNFEELRKLQKTFEDLFNLPDFYNYLGLAFIAGGDKKLATQYFIENSKNAYAVKKYALLRLALVTDQEIKDNAIEKIDQKIQTLYSAISHPDVYNSENKELVFSQLFRLNVEAANIRKLKFEFLYRDNNEYKRFFDYRSLEHIWPKSKICFTDENNVKKCWTEKDEQIVAPLTNVDMIDRSRFSEGVTEHCIGNLVFLHKYDNSRFNAKTPENKKKVYFELSEELHSRNLLHTMSVFAIDNWTIDRTPTIIKDNKQKVTSAIREGYNCYVNNA
jgi:hypothetical protein